MLINSEISNASSFTLIGEFFLILLNGLSVSNNNFYIPNLEIIFFTKVLLLYKL